MRTFAMLAAAVLAAGCVRTSTNPATGEVDVDIESPTKQGEDWTAKINAVNSGISGDARALVSQGQTNITVTLSGGMAGMSHIWVIHEGRCTQLGPVFTTPGQYPQVTFDSNGRATVNVTLNGRLDEAKQYVVAIHGNGAELVACGELDD